MQNNYWFCSVDKLRERSGS